MDDDDMAREFTAECMRRAGHQVDVCAGAAAAMRRISEHQPHLVLCDLRMPEIDGLGLLDWVHVQAPEVDFIMLTAHSDLDAAVQCIRRGGSDYVTKPFSAAELQRRVALVLNSAATARRTRASYPQVDTMAAHCLIGCSPGMQLVRDRIALAADRDLGVLIIGETGTGKELVATALHAASWRRHKPFIAVNCAAIPEALIGSELFGHERGSFTTATNARVGRFEAAEGGSLFLDEIGDLPETAQGSLLRVLQEKSFERIGSNRTRKADVRIIAATRCDLQALVRTGRFREDLFYRLNVLQIVCPALRERPEDIPLLVEHFLRHPGGAETDGRELRISSAARDALMRYDWPGNVRELENALARAALVARDGEIQPGDLDLPASGGPPGDAANLLEDAERAIVHRALEQCGWNQSRAARTLGIDRGTLARKMARFGLRAPFLGLS